MICVSLSDQFVRFAQVVREEGDFSIKFVDKKVLPFLFDPSQLSHTSFAEKMDSVFKIIRERLIVSEEELLLTVSDEWVDMLIQRLDVGLPRPEALETLNWTVGQRFGKQYEKRYIQHYNLVSDLTFEATQYLTVSYLRQLRDVLVNSAQNAGFQAVLLDVGIFSALQAIQTLYPVTNYKTWGVWQIGKEKHSLVIVDTGEFSNYAEFELLNNYEFKIRKKALVDDAIDKVIDEINQTQYSTASALESVDFLYYYAYDVSADFYNMVLLNDMSNMKPVNPFVMHTPVKHYIDDGDGEGAMCQFVDLMGLILRGMSKGPK